MWCCAWLMVVACTRVEKQEVSLRICASVKEGRACAMCFAADSSIFIAGGRIQDGTFSPTMLCYDVPSDAWRTMDCPITPRVNGTACSTTAGVYLGLGWAGGYVHSDSLYLRDWWRYEPATDTWTRLADFPTDKTAGAVCWSDDKTVWVASGFHGYTNDIWAYDIAADRWTKADFAAPARVMSPVATQCQHRYFFGTGFYETSRNGWWEWLNEGQWEKRASVPGRGRHNAACASSNEAVWLIGGWHYGDSLTTGFVYDDILRYSPATNSWAYCGALPCGTMENGAAAAVGNKVFFGLGEDKNGIIHTSWYSIEE